jgi:hypothetical protein
MMKTLIVLAMAMVISAGAPRAQVAEQPPPVPAQEEPEVLASGPVHEAFAEPVDLNAEPGIVASEQPPPDIDEVIPAQKPSGNYVWVPGYWAWDSAGNDYIWVSGCWRLAPPNTSWVPGYWTQVADGWQWVAGFWSPTSGNGEIEYLPAPPPVEDVAPPATTASSDEIWVPPCYYWRGGQYVLRCRVAACSSRL